MMANVTERDSLGFNVIGAASAPLIVSPGLLGESSIRALTCASANATKSFAAVQVGKALESASSAARAIVPQAGIPWHDVLPWLKRVATPISKPLCSPRPG